ncbi:MAG TPA: hypothetical protein VHF27_13210 [Acidimicrobiales bacterium]|nr:hypothetical protein [Acidimicrobiales bacterium]
MNEDSAKVLTEFGGNRAAMAAEIVRLRSLLEEAGYEISRLAVSRPGATVLYPSASPPVRPIGLRPRA